ncbi:MAG: MOSC domain-containing protein [Beijerinckiaceae bacterium]|nr:MOSC domain-containing protein [Beijerinckiaceae bacterium]
MKVTAIYRYPVKSLRGTALKETQVERIGLAGDRRWMVVDADGRFQTIRESPVMTQIGVALEQGGITLSHPAVGHVFVPLPDVAAPRRTVRVWHDTLEAVEAAPEAGTFLSKALGFNARLVYMADVESRPVDPTYGSPEDRTSFADGFPVLITTTASLDDLNTKLTHPIDMNRFRPNIVIDGTLPWAEDEWRVIEIAGIPFRIVKPCGRCIVVTRDAMTGVAGDDQEPLRTLSRYRRSAAGKPIFGQNVIPDAIGAISVGDAVKIVETGPSNLL